jgi:hypothetical protein
MALAVLTACGTGMIQVGIASCRSIARLLVKIQLELNHIKNPGNLNLILLLLLVDVGGF